MKLFGSEHERHIMLRLHPNLDNVTPSVSPKNVI